MAATAQPITFAGGAGAVLAGAVHEPAGARGTLLLTHCFTCSKDLPLIVRLARGLVRGGYRVLRFDFTGVGDSEGAFVETTVGTRVDDVVAAAEAMAARGHPPDGLVGHSLGGVAVLLAAARIGSVRSVAVLNAPFGPQDLERLFAHAADEIRREGSAPVRLAGRPFPISAAFLDDLGRHDIGARLAQLDRPLLVLHAVEDEEVAVAHGERLFAAARQPKAFVPLLGADHLLSDRRRVDEAASYAAGWFDRTL